MKVVKQLNLRTKSQSFKVFLLCIAFLFLNTSGSDSIKPLTANAASITKAPSEELTVEEYTVSVKQRAINKLTLEVKTFIDNKAPGTKLTPSSLVENCIKYDMDLVFVIAQGMLESHLGTKGKAVETNSVWNVGTFDNGQILYRYTSQDESIIPYLELLQESYLINITSKGDTIYKDVNHLLEDNGYKNYNGKRFATARGYENSLRKLMVKINMETSISLYQSIIQMSNDEILFTFGPDKPLSKTFYIAQNTNRNI